jgi:hypothetical protein
VAGQLAGGDILGTFSDTQRLRNPQPGAGGSPPPAAALRLALGQQFDQALSRREPRGCA